MLFFGQPSTHFYITIAIVTRNIVHYDHKCTFSPNRAGQMSLHICVYLISEGRNIP